MRGRTSSLAEGAAQRRSGPKCQVRKMPCLCSLPWYWAVEGTAGAECLATAHAMHPHTARLTALENEIMALCTLEALDKHGVALPQVGRDVLAFSFALAVLGPKWLAIVARLR